MRLRESPGSRVEFRKSTRVDTFISYYEQYSQGNVWIPAPAVPEGYVLEARRRTNILM